MNRTADGPPVDGQPPAVDTPQQQPPQQQPPPWARKLTIVTALVWGSCELALWGARPQALGFIFAMVMGTEGVLAASRIRGLLQQ